jgi:hypothetical protein
MGSKAMGAYSLKEITKNTTPAIGIKSLLLIPLHTTIIKRMPRGIKKG